MNFSNLILLAQAASPAPEGAAAPPSGLFIVGQLVLLGVIFYFLLIRPQQKQRKEHEKLIASVKTGDKIVTGSGIHGIVSNVKDRTVVVKVADNVKIEFERSAIVSVDRSGETEVVSA